MSKRKTWRCFHCDEVFRSRKAAWAHFAARLKELREAQEYTLHCQESANRAEDKLDDIQRELAEFKTITGCSGLHELRMWMDSQQGRVVTANALIDGFRKAAPELAAQIIG